MNQDEARRGARQRLARRLLVKSVYSPSTIPLDSQTSRGARRASVVIVDENRSRNSTDQHDIDGAYRDLCIPERKSAEGRLEGERVRVGELVVVLTPPEETKQPSSTLFPLVSSPSPTFSFRPKKRSSLRSSFTRSDSSFTISGRTRTSGSDSSSRSIRRSNSLQQQCQTIHQAENEDVDYDYSNDNIQDGLWGVSPTPFPTPSQEVPSNPFDFDSARVHMSEEEPRLREPRPALNVFGIETTSHSQMEVDLDGGFEEQQLRSRYAPSPPPDAPLPTLPTTSTLSDIESSSEVSLVWKDDEKVESSSANKFTTPSFIPKENGPNDKEPEKSLERTSFSTQISDDSSSLVDVKLTESDLCTLSIENPELSPPKMKEDKKEKGSRGKTLKTFRSFTKLLKLVGVDGKKNTVVKHDTPTCLVQESSSSIDRAASPERDLSGITPDVFVLSDASDHELLPPNPLRLSRSGSVYLKDDENYSNQTPTKKAIGRKLSLASLSNAIRSSGRKKSTESLRGTRSSFSSDATKSPTSENIPAVPPIPSWVRLPEDVDSTAKSSPSFIQTQPSLQTSSSTPTPVPAPTTKKSSTGSDLFESTSVSNELQAVERPSSAVEAASWALSMVYTEAPSSSPVKTASFDTNIEGEAKTESEQDGNRRIEQDVQKREQLFEPTKAQIEVDVECASNSNNKKAGGMERGREIPVDTERSPPETDTEADTDTEDEGFFDAEEGEFDQSVSKINPDNGKLNEDDLSHAVIGVLRAHSGSTVSASVSTASSVSSALSTTSRSTTLSTPIPTPYMSDTVVFGALSGSIQNLATAQTAVNGIKIFDNEEKAGGRPEAGVGGNSLSSEGWGVGFESLNFEDLELELSL